MASVNDFLAEAYHYAREAGLSDHVARLAVAQAALETGYGASVKGNNYHGIKAGRSWKGPVQKFKTWEDVGGKRVNIVDRFRKYSSPVESFKDWRNLIGKRWPEVLTAKNFDQAVAGLRTGQQGGYATDKKYVAKMDYINRRIDRAGPGSYKPIPANGPIPTPRPTGNPYQDYANTRNYAPVSPTPRPQTAPISPVERAPLLAASRIPAAAPVPVSRNYPSLGGTRTALAPTPGDRLAPAPASRLGPAAAPRLQPNPEPEPVQASNFTLGNPGMGLADQYATYGAGKLGMPTPAPPLSPPTVVNPPPQIFDLPVPAPYNPLQAAIDSAPGPQPNVPRGSQAAYDFYNGQNDQAFASTGEALNRDRHGNTYITNKYGVTTGTDQRGNSFRASSIPGPIGDQQQANGGILGADWDKIGQKAKPALGGALGAGLGGLLGPVGATLGGAIGRELAKPGGGRLGSLMRGEKSLNVTDASGFTQRMGFARPQGGLAFPNAPSGGIRPDYSDRDYERMERISPKATRDIKSGKTGLF